MAFPENTVNDIGIKHIWDKVVAALSGKVDKVSGKGLSTNDYTTAEKTKLEGIEAGAQVNTVTSVAGKTGAVTLDKADVGLGNVDNTSDANKPISTATQNALDDKADANDVKSTQTATGNPITITDAAGINAEALKVTFSPKQDLHGYDFPWVGGAGKNKLPMTVEGIKAANASVGSWSGNVYSYRNVNFTIVTDSANNVTGIDVDTGGNTASGNVWFFLDSTTLKAGTYTLSGTPSNMPTGCYLYDDSSFGGWKDETGEGQSKTFSEDTTGYGVIMVASGATLSHALYKPMIESGSQKTTFSSYSNECPITGYTEVGVEDVGKNLFDKSDVINGGFNSNGLVYESAADSRRVSGFITIKPQTDYYISNAVALTAGRTGFWYDENQATISQITFPSTVQTSGAVTSPSNAKYIRICVPSDTLDTAQIEKGSTATTYEPYQSTSATISFSQTLYGGVSDFVEGGTEDEWEEVVFNGSNDEQWILYSAPDINQFYINISGVKSSAGGLITTLCDTFKSISVDDRYENYDTCYTGPDWIGFNVENVANVSAWKTWLASNNVQVVYEKATPTTLSTHKADLKLLQGTNNLTTNGTTITLDYIPNNSIGDAVKASEEYTDRAVERVAPKATLIDTWMISEESDTISVDLTSYDCNFFLLEYLFNSKRGTTLIPRPQGGSFSASVVTYNSGSAYYVELTYNPTTKELAYTSNVTSQFGILAIYTI